MAYSNNYSKINLYYSIINIIFSAVYVLSQGGKTWAIQAPSERARASPCAVLSPERQPHEI